MPKKYGKCTRDFGAFLFLFQSTFLYFGGVFNKTIILLALVGYEIIPCSANMVSKRVIFEAFLVLVQSNFLYFGGFLIKLPFALVGYEIDYSQRSPSGRVGYLLGSLRNHNGDAEDNVD